MSRGVAYVAAAAARFPSRKTARSRAGANSWHTKFTCGSCTRAGNGAGHDNPGFIDRHSVANLAAANSRNYE